VIDKRDIEKVRSFNRLVTRQVGALNDGYLGSGRPLGESRVLFEVARNGDTTPRDIRARLGLDSGYVTRMLRSLERDGLISSAPDPDDGRTKRLTLTTKGRAETARLDKISDDLAAAVLEPLTPDERARLLEAQKEVRRLLAISMVTMEEEDPASPDARWCLDHYFAELSQRFGLDPTKTLAADPTGIDVFLMARISGQPAGCGALKTLDSSTGELTRMWVDPAHRGLGIAQRLLDDLEAAARARGHGRVRLYTNRALHEADAMYVRAGYAEIPRYNDDPYADNWLEKRLGP
jgi:DNA-binding MarR family transcriptional regulator